ncbi:MULTISPECIES: NAD(P)-dependent alcohol dehydrogenase [unclassified Pantoea]|uniref:NAD(P)-dependent alcohol dehydrogenase n=1 Tax=unclassified Pantoea TaxID=2630326 RepID=UPI001CD4F060|nr:MULTISPECIES: NAD(P)-dependent alcohol dehydrogenase [unclassified Pantoea]MCA1179590.1 NAD(P)-dependent alcohol dehydrogenase [Pantoea sp. alder69]MCA1251843.1 NAD(P)-dependent alcohol dehydrogenase [Pantoea sp. alder70]MCA1267820.1 NAD(P)-dependent alcohol dehydrogenase [Pantoea sp. alder81]
MTYGSPVPESVEPTGVTQGGYSTAAVVNKDFVIKIPKEYDLAAAGPVMCAAVTVYSPLRHWQVRKDSKVAIVGMGGLGHLAVKLAKSMGAEVVVFTTSPDKADDARRFGAHDVVVNYDAEKLKKLNRHFDFVLDTVPYQHELDPIMNTMKRDATLCLVGIGKVSEPNQLSPFTTVLRRYSFAGSTIGGIRETQEVIDYCNLHGIKPDYRLIKPSDINQTWSDVVAKKARYRYVMDLKQI